MNPVAVVLSGCGYLDGAEITEAVATLVALGQAGLAYQVYAPDRLQMHVVDHVRCAPAEEARNILVESARIARGQISPLAQLDPAAHAALVLPGGFGAAKNLCNFAVAGEQAVLHDDMKAALLPFVQARKPVMALCAAPLLVALAAREAGITGARLTVGAGGEPLAAALEAWGQQHVALPVEQACVDATHRFVTAPAYMYGEASPAQVFASTVAAVAGLRELLR